MKRSPLNRRTALRPGSGLRAVSPKRARRQREYAKLRGDYLTGHPRCGFPGGCTQPAVEIHHRRGRVGADYLDVSHWTGLCSPHHRWVTEHPQLAYGMGLSERRLGGAA